jgi:hypothetical protein
LKATVRLMLDQLNSILLKRLIFAQEFRRPFGLNACPAPRFNMYFNFIYWRGLALHTAWTTSPNIEVAPSSMLKVSSQGSIVLTIALGPALTIVQPQRSVDSYNFGGTDFDYTTGSKHQKPAQLLNKSTAHCLNKRIRFQAGTIVATKKSMLNCFLMA